MRAIIFQAILALLPASAIFSQSTKQHRNSIGFSLPLIWNHSSGVYYSLGNRSEPKGSALSYALNLEFKRNLLSMIYIKATAGYMNQRFKITRPFNYPTSNNLQYSTGTYNYHSYVWSVGLGASYPLERSVEISGDVNYVSIISFAQKYTVYDSESTLKRNKRLIVGSQLTLNPELSKAISKRAKIGCGLIVPLLVKWKKDDVFVKSDFSEDSQIIAQNRFSIGIAIAYKISF